MSPALGVLDRVQVGEPVRRHCRPGHTREQTHNTEDAIQIIANSGQQSPNDKKPRTSLPGFPSEELSSRHYTRFMNFPLGACFGVHIDASPDPSTMARTHPIHTNT